jgi:hypothetical protein
VQHWPPGVAITAQMQSEGPTALAHADQAGTEEVSRKIYLNSGPDLGERVAGIVRPPARGGDMLQLNDGTWWLVVGVIEDFSRSGDPGRSGWVCARVTLQVLPPDCKI